MSSPIFFQHIQQQINFRLAATLGGSVRVREAFTVSLSGEWGIGKTEALKTLESMYDEALCQTLWSADSPLALTIPVFFSPWRFEHEAQLVTPLMDAIQAKLESLMLDEQGTLRDKPWAQRLASAAANFTQASRGVPVGDSLVWLSRVCASDSLTASPIALRFVVLIDDLDRCLPDKAVQILECIKLFFDVSAFAFVIGLDNEIIERGIRHRYQAYLKMDGTSTPPFTGSEYLENLVQLPLTLPRLREDQVRTLLESYRDKLMTCLPVRASDAATQTAEERVAAVFELLSILVPPVPRKLTRAVKGLLFKLAMMKAEHPNNQKISELFALRLVVLEQLYPTVYWLIKNDARNWPRLLTVHSNRGVLSIADEVNKGVRLTLTGLNKLIDHAEGLLENRIQVDSQLQSKLVSYFDLRHLLKALIKDGGQRNTHDPLVVFRPQPDEDLSTPWAMHDVYMHYGAPVGKSGSDGSTSAKSKVEEVRELMHQSVTDEDQSVRHQALMRIDFVHMEESIFKVVLALPYFDPTQPEYKKTFKDKNWWESIEAQATTAGLYQKEIWSTAKMERHKKHKLLTPRYQLEDDLDSVKAQNVLDLKTGLVWRRKCESEGGKSGDQSDQSDQSDQFTFGEAKIHAKTESSKTKQAWRLPTKEELEDLVDNRERNSDEGLATIARESFPDTPSVWFWSATPSAADSYVAWGVSFSDGYASCYDRDSKGFVRLVR